MNQKVWHLYLEDRESNTTRFLLPVSENEKSLEKLK